MTTAIDKLMQAASELAPIISAHSEQAERERRLAKPVVDAMASAGLFRLNAPTSLGGYELDPVSFARIVESVSQIDSAAGWILQAGNIGAWWAARLPQAGVEEIYSKTPDVLMAASFSPPQRALEVDGGYRITGRGPLASNVHESEWLFLSALVFDGDSPRVVDGRPVAIAAIPRTREVEIVDTWYSLGMRGSDSNDVVMNDVFVPSSRTIPLVPRFEPGAHYKGPLYQFPVIGTIGTFVAPVALGVARAAIDELRVLAERKRPFASTKPLRERSATHIALAKAEGTLRAARALFYETVQAAWERTRAGAVSTLVDRADLLLAGAYAVSSATSAVDQMHRLAGSSGIYARSRLERLFRDAHTLRHHGFVSEGRFEAVGQIYMGLPPEFELVAF